MAVQYRVPIWRSVEPPDLGTTTPPSGPLPQGTVVTITATPNAYYTFLNWNGSGVGSLMERHVRLRQHGVDQPAPVGFPRVGTASQKNRPR